MRLAFYSFTQDAPNHQWIYYHFADELTRGGHEVVMINGFDHGVGLSRDEYDEYITETVAREHKRSPISLFFTMVKDRSMSASAVARISDLGIPTAMLGGDDCLVPFLSKSLAPAFDVYWVADGLSGDKMRKYGANVFEAPIAANPLFYRPVDVPQGIDVSFCGQRYGSRSYYVEELARREIAVDVSGVGWTSSSEGIPTGHRTRLKLLPALRHVAASMHHSHGRTWARAALLRRLRKKKSDPQLQEWISQNAHPPAPYSEIAKLYSRSKLTLGFSEFADTYLLKNPLVSFRSRDMEAFAAGACHLIYRFPFAEEHFEEGKEVVFYSSADELADKIRYYLDPRRDALRAEIGRNARARIVESHTWTHRFMKIFEMLGMPNESLSTGGVDV